MGLGDDLMWLGEASKVHEENPDAVVHDGREYSPVWKHNDWVVSPDYNGPKKKILVPRKPNGNRWYIQGWGPGKIYYKKYNPLPAPYVFHRTEMDTASSILFNNGIDKQPFVIVNPDTKNTTLSVNKDWGFSRWQQLTDMLSKHITVVRVKPDGPVRDVSGYVQYNQKTLDNAINISENDIRISFAIMSQAQAIVTSEGALHHFAAAIDMPAYVIYGGAIHPQQTGYKNRNQTNYVYGDEPCGSQVPCDHCREAMASIKPDTIFKDVMKIL